MVNICDMSLHQAFQPMPTQLSNEFFPRRLRSVSLLFQYFACPSANVNFKFKLIYLFTFYVNVNLSPPTNLNTSVYRRSKICCNARAGIHTRCGCRVLCSYYSDVIMSAMVSQTPAYRLFGQSFVQAQIKENIKAPRLWPLWWESTGDR